eukprot:1926190-Rhodomonas_salina.2
MDLEKEIQSVQTSLGLLLSATGTPAKTSLARTSGETRSEAGQHVRVWADVGGRFLAPDSDNGRTQEARAEDQVRCCLVAPRCARCGACLGRLGLLLLWCDVFAGPCSLQPVSVCARVYVCGCTCARGCGCLSVSLALLVPLPLCLSISVSCLCLCLCVVDGHGTAGGGGGGRKAEPSTAGGGRGGKGRGGAEGEDRGEGDDRSMRGVARRRGLRVHHSGARRGRGRGRGREERGGRSVESAEGRGQVLCTPLRHKRASRAC